MSTENFDLLMWFALILGAFGGYYGARFVSRKVKAFAKGKDGLFWKVVAWLFKWPGD